MSSATPKATSSLTMAGVISSAPARKFDVIVVDPPPPVQAAGSSLLYSKEFYVLARQHLKPGGILQMWFPGGEDWRSDTAGRPVPSTNRFRMCAVSRRWKAGACICWLPWNPSNSSRRTNWRRGCPIAAKRIWWNGATSDDLPAYLGLVVVQREFPFRAAAQPRSRNPSHR